VQINNTNLKIHIRVSSTPRYLYLVYEIKSFTFSGLNPSILFLIRLSLRSVTSLTEDKLQNRVYCLLCRS